MISTVTLNPSIDRLYMVEGLAPGTVMRVQKLCYTAGGKGLNVSRVAALCGARVNALGFVGGHAGRHICDMLLAEGIRPVFTEVGGESRICINVRDLATGQHTEFLEPGAPVTEGDAARFMVSYRAALPQSRAVTLSGSLPAGLAPDFYAGLVREAKAAGVPVLLDTSGASLGAAIQARPTLVKPNRDEIAQLLGQRPEGRQPCVEAAKALHAGGVAYAVVSLGAEGSVMACDEGVFLGLTPDVPVVNTVGCGDSMLAALAVGITRGYGAGQMLHFATAVSTANACCMQTGYFEATTLAELQNQVQVERLA